MDDTFGAGEGEMMNGVSRVYFPLRSSVEFFDRPSGVTPSARAKEGAVLFDEVLFEDGQFTAAIGEDMNFTSFRPRHELTDDDLKQPAMQGEVGERFSISIGVQRAPDDSAKELQPLGETVVRDAYSVQWHSTAIDELQALGVTWADFGAPSEEDLRGLQPAINATTREFADRLRGNELPHFQADYIAKALARDAVVASALHASINITPMFAPMVEGAINQQEQTGAEALSFLVPNLERLPWEAIAEFRDMPGSVEARGLLREFEAIALSEEPGDATDFGNKVKQSVADALAGAVLDSEANVAKAAAREGIGLVVSLVPYVGQFIGAAAGIADAIGQRAEQRGNGIFALVKLREASSAHGG
ncbi:MAG TPA: hypothetical protein VHS74_08385 [Solirubrobacterales bacterium]|nr:hypothetical protein [Solirubrobacterales bacterium]